MTDIYLNKIIYKSYIFFWSGRVIRTFLNGFKGQNAGYSYTWETKGMICDINGSENEVRIIYSYGKKIFVVVATIQVNPKSFYRRLYFQKSCIFCVKLLTKEFWSFIFEFLLDFAHQLPLLANDWSWINFVHREDMSSGFSASMLINTIF